MARKFFLLHIVMLILLLFCHLSGHAEEKDDLKKAEAIKTYLAQHFGVPGSKIPWYDNIIDVKVKGDTASVMTNLSPGDQREIANVCGVVSGFVYSHLNAALKITKVEIVGGSDKVLLFRKSALDACIP